MGQTLLSASDSHSRFMLVLLHDRFSYPHFTDESTVLERSDDHPAFTWRARHSVSETPYWIPWALVLLRLIPGVLKA